MSYQIGLDLGGTNIKGGLLNSKAEVLAKRSIATEADQGPAHVMDRMAELSRTLAEEAGVQMTEISAVGVGTPGPTDAECAVVLGAPNLKGWVNIPLRDELKARLDRPIRVFNDANVAAYGEFWTGAGEEASDMILLTLGTGVGGGIIIAGELFAGAHNAGTELGHMIMQINGRPCPCGQLGCLEQYASANAIARDAQRLLDEGRSSQLPANPTSKDVFEAAQQGDAVSVEVLDTFADYLGVACVNLVRIFDPQVIVLGGGVVAAGATLTDRVRKVFDAQTWTIRPEQVVLKLASLGNDAGFIGAAGLVAPK
ncbi:MAG: ROK family glucokinase [Phycisphaeraceae bacterium]